MIEAIVSFIEGVLIPYGAFGVFVASFLEEVVAPIPSAVVLLTAGFVFLHSVPFSILFITKLFFIIVIPAAIGMTLGSFFLYGIGYISGKPAVVRFGRYFGITWEDVEKAEVRFSRTNKDEFTLALLRATPIVPNTAVSAVCGLIRFPIFTYLWVSFIGFGLRALILAVLGSQVGSFYHYYGDHFEIAEKYIIATLGVAIIAILYILYRRRYTRTKNDRLIM